MNSNWSWPKWLSTKSKVFSCQKKSIAKYFDWFLKSSVKKLKKCSLERKSAVRNVFPNKINAKEICLMNNRERRMRWAITFKKEKNWLSLIFVKSLWESSGLEVLWSFFPSWKLKRKPIDKQTNFREMLKGSFQIGQDLPESLLKISLRIFTWFNYSRKNQ